MMSESLLILYPEIVSTLSSRRFKVSGLTSKSVINFPRGFVFWFLSEWLFCILKGYFNFVTCHFAWSFSLHIVLSNHIPFISFSFFLLLLTRMSSSVFNKGGESVHLVLFLFLVGMLWVVLHLTWWWLYMCYRLIMLIYVPSIPSLSRVFLMKGC